MLGTHVTYRGYTLGKGNFCLTEATFAPEKNDSIRQNGGMGKRTWPTWNHLVCCGQRSKQEILEEASRHRFGLGSGPQKSGSSPHLQTILTSKNSQLYQDLSRLFAHRPKGGCRQHIPTYIVHTHNTYISAGLIGLPCPILIVALHLFMTFLFRHHDERLCQLFSQYTKHRGLANGLRLPLQARPSTTEYNVDDWVYTGQVEGVQWRQVPGGIGRFRKQSSDNERQGERAQFKSP